MYKVVRNFIDKDGREYQVNDVYPHPDAKKSSNARLKVLSTTNNKYEQIYIVKDSPEKG